MRLNRFIAKTGFCSRRKADLLIKEGKVKVNGVYIKEPWYRVEDKDRIEIDNMIINHKKIEYKYIIINKPKGVVCTLKDRFAERKIIDLLPQSLKNLYPVGRLDKNSCGLLILTNDGDFCFRLTHPKFNIEKEYIVKIKGDFDRKMIEKAQRGVKDGKDILKVKSIKIIKKNEKGTCLRIVAVEGKKRHIRRLLKNLGVEVIELQRIRIGRLRLGNLKEGEYKILTKKPVI